MTDEERRQKVIAELQSGRGGLTISFTDRETGETTTTSFDEARKMGFTNDILSQTIPYYKVGNSYSPKEPTTSTISLDKATGNINIVAPKSITGDAEFKAQVAFFEDFSSNYKINPNAEYTIKNSDGTAEGVTLEEYIERLNTPTGTGIKDKNGEEIKISPWQSEVDQYLYANSVREMLAPLYQQIDAEGNVSAVPLTRTDIIRMTTNGLGADVKDSTRLAMPEGFDELKAIYSDENWDSETSSTTIGKFKELFHNREKTDQQEILSLYRKLGNYLAESRTPTNVEDVDVKKWTAAYALFNYMSETDPTCAMFRTAWDYAGALANSAGQVAINYAAGYVQGVETAVGKAHDVVVNLIENGVNSDVFKKRDIDKKYFAETIKEVMEIKFFAQKWGYGLFSFERAANDYYELERMQQELAPIMGIGVDAATAARLSSTGPDPNLTSGADSFRKLATNLIQIGVAIKVGNVLAAGAKHIAASVAADAIAEASSMTELVSEGYNAYVALAGAENTVKLFNMVGNFFSSKVVTELFGLVGESIGEGIFQSPEVLAEILRSETMEPEAREYLWDTFLGNFSGLMMATAVGNAAMAIGTTARGQAISRNLRNTFYKFQGWVADSIDALRVKLSGAASVEEWINKIGSKGITEAGRSRYAQKAQIMNQQRAIRKMRQYIADNSDKIKIAGETTESILKQIDEVDKKIASLLEAEDLLDDILRGNNFRKLNILEDNPLFQVADTKLRTVAGDLIDLQTQAGLKAAAKVGDMKLFSNELTEYIGARIRTDIGNSAIAAKNLSKAVNATEGIDVIQKELGHWSEVIEKFEGRYSADLVAKANEYIDATKDWWKQFNDYRVKAGLISKVDIAKWREEGIWGENGELYARQQRKAEQSNFVLARRDGKVTKDLVRDMGHYNWGSTDDFVDPMLVAQQDFELAAEQINRLEFARTYSQTTGTSTVVKSAEDVRIANEVRPYLRNYNKEATNAIKPLVNEIKTDGIFNEMAARTDLAREQRAVERQAYTLGNTKVSKKAVTQGEVQAAMVNLDKSSVDTLWTQVYGNKTVTQVATENPELVTGRATKRAILANSDATGKAPFMKDTVRQARELEVRHTLEFLQPEAAETAARLEAELELADQAINDAAAQTIADFKERFFAKGTNAHKVADELAMRFGGDTPDLLKDFLYYDSLVKVKGSVTNQIKTKAEKFFKDFEIEVDGKKVRPYKNNASHIANSLTKNISERIELEFNTARATLAKAGGDGAKLIDHDSWQKAIYEAANEITGLSKEANNIFMRNAAGEIELVQVDPLLSSFINSTSQYTPMGALGRANYLWMRLFRLGTTGINPSSWVNQYYRDLGNAWIMGNVSQTLGQATEELTEVFGKNAGYYLSQYSNDVQENLLKLANEQKKSIASVMAEREIRRGQLYAQTSSETEMTRLWRGTKNQWFTGSQQRGLWDRSMDVFDKIEEKAGMVNEVREQYLRNLVYGNNFAAAIKGGKSIKQAQIFAEYIASNATTNFTRGVTFMSQFQNSIPYFRAAVNGTRSFYRLWSLDPVGVTGRLIGGLIVPAFALTIASNSSEENRQAYRKIQDYLKEDALPIVVDGEIFFVPLPQELSAFIAPFRQAAEAIVGNGYNNLLEVAVNDLLALSPIDFGGFTDIDSWRVYGEAPDWGERLTSGSAKLFSQIMPKWAVAAATFASGRDLYTGNKIDTSYVTVDPDTGEQQVMTYTAGVIANQLNKAFPGLAAPIAQEMLENIFGTAGAEVMNFLADIIGRTTTMNFDYAAAAKSFGEEVLTDLGQPMRKFVEARETADWRHTMSDLWDMKNEILSPNTPKGQAWQAMLTNKRNAKTQTERDAVATARANILDPFYDTAISAVRKLIAANPSAFTDYKLGSVLSLFNFGTTGDLVNSAAEEGSSDVYKQSKYAAVETMIKLGFPNNNQPSILGSIVSSASGTYIKWNTPLQILDMENTIYAQGAIYAADIKRLLAKNGIDSNALSAAYDAYYGTEDKAKRQQIATEWDTKVAVAIAPYIQTYGAESVTSANDVLDFLDGYLIIPNDYLKYNGKSTYNPKVNINRGYAKSFLKEVFGAKK